MYEDYLKVWTKSTPKNKAGFIHWIFQRRGTLWVTRRYYWASTNATFCHRTTHSVLEQIPEQGTDWVWCQRGPRYGLQPSRLCSTRVSAKAGSVICLRICLWFGLWSMCNEPDTNTRSGIELTHLPLYISFFFVLLFETLSLQSRHEVRHIYPTRQILDSETSRSTGTIQGAVDQLPRLNNYKKTTAKNTN